MEKLFSLRNKKTKQPNDIEFSIWQLNELWEENLEFCDELTFSDLMVESLIESHNEGGLFFFNSELIKNGSDINLDENYLLCIKEKRNKTLIIDYIENIQNNHHWSERENINQKILFSLFDFYELIFMNYSKYKIENEEDLFFMENCMNSFFYKLKKVIEENLPMYKVIREKNKIYFLENNHWIQNSNLSKQDNEIIFSYYNVKGSISDKKKSLQNIATIIESKITKKKFKEKKEDLFLNTISKSLESFKFIVNRLDFVRHSTKNTISYEEEKEILLLDLAMDLAYFILHSLESLN